MNKSESVEFQKICQINQRFLHLEILIFFLNNALFFRIMLIFKAHYIIWVVFAS